MMAVETRKNRFESAVTAWPCVPSATFGKTQDAMMVACVIATTRSGQTYSSPVATIVSVSPA